MANFSQDDLLSYFTDNGEDIWQFIAYYPVPSLTLENVRTGERKDFGFDSLDARKFMKIEMPKVAANKH